MTLPTIGPLGAFQTKRPFLKLLTTFSTTFITATPTEIPTGQGGHRDKWRQMHMSIRLPDLLEAIQQFSKRQTICSTTYKTLCRNTRTLKRPLITSKTIPTTLGWIIFTELLQTNPSLLQRPAASDSGDAGRRVLNFAVRMRKEFIWSAATSLPLHIFFSITTRCSHRPLSQSRIRVGPIQIGNVSDTLVVRKMESTSAARTMRAL